MKKFISFLIFVMLFSTACGNEIKSDNSTSTQSNTTVEKKEDKILLANSFWIENADYMPFLVDALNRNDREYLEQLIMEKKVFVVTKDTRVKSFGYAADKNNELISFKEGRYTNRAGVTFKKFLCSESEYQKRIETQKIEERKKEEEYQKRIETQKAQERLKAEKFREESVNLISSALNETADYENVITNSDFNYLSQFDAMCVSKKDFLQKQIYNSMHDDNIRNMFDKASKIMNERHSAIYFYLQLLQYYQKYSQARADDYATKFASERAMQNFKKMTDESIQQEKQFRQEFRNTYGF